MIWESPTTLDTKFPPSLTLLSLKTRIEWPSVLTAIASFIKQIDSMLLCVGTVRDHRGRQNVVRTSVTHSAIASCATFLFLPHFDIICDLLLNRRTVTWNLFVKLRKLLHHNWREANLSLMLSSCEHWIPVKLWSLDYYISVAKDVVIIITITRKPVEWIFVITSISSIYSRRDDMVWQKNMMYHKPTPIL